MASNSRFLIRRCLQLLASQNRNASLISHATAGDHLSLSNLLRSKETLFSPASVFCAGVCFKHTKIQREEKRSKRDDLKAKEKGDDDEEDEDEDEEEEIVSGKKPISKQKVHDQTAKSTASTFDLKDLGRKMEEVLAAYQSELAKVRSGRANPGLIEPVQVSLGNHERVPLKSLATITVSSSQALMVAVYNSEHVGPVVAALEAPPMKLTARVEGEKEILVPLPRMSLEMVTRMTKLVAQEAETARVKLRTLRQKAVDIVKKTFKSIDDQRRHEKEIQALLEKYNGNVDKLKAAKEKDLKENH